MRSLIVVVAACAALTSVAAGAAEPTPDELIARGLELRRQSKPGEALELFRRAQAVAPSPRTLGQLGLVEASLEHWLDAEAHLNAALATPDEAWVQKNRGFLNQALNMTGAHIGELVVTGPNGTDVAVDGKHVGTLPALRPLRRAEGSAVVTATGTGFKDVSKTVTVVRRAKTALAIVLDAVVQRPAVAVAAPAPLPAPPPAPAPGALGNADQPARSWKKPVGASLIAAGVSLAAWGLGLARGRRQRSLRAGGNRPATASTTRRRAAGFSRQPALRRRVQAPCSRSWPGARTARTSRSASRRRR